MAPPRCTPEVDSVGPSRQCSIRFPPPIHSPSPFGGLAMATYTLKVNGTEQLVSAYDTGFNTTHADDIRIYEVSVRGARRRVGEGRGVNCVY